MNTIPERGDWLQTFVGKQFFPLDPKAYDVDIRDIAHALARQCRFSGHVAVEGIYSVAQHSVLVSRVVEEQHALHGLLHDASEAYLVDLPRPIKHATALGVCYLAIETRVQDVICERFGLAVDANAAADVKRADDVVLATEKRDLMGPPPAVWSLGIEPLADKIIPWSPADAEACFLERFFHLWQART